MNYWNRLRRIASLILLVVAVMAVLGAVGHALYAPSTTPADASSPNNGGL
jgi:hypothetical protein